MVINFLIHSFFGHDLAKLRIQVKNLTIQAKGNLKKDALAFYGYSVYQK